MCADDHAQDGDHHRLDQLHQSAHRGVHLFLVEVGDLGEHRIERTGRVLRQIGLAELELATVFAEHRFEDQLAHFAFDGGRARFRGAANFGGAVGRFSSGGVGLAEQWVGHQE